jgi:hypothetical protein
MKHDQDQCYGHLDGFLFSAKTKNAFLYFKTEKMNNTNVFLLTNIKCIILLKNNTEFASPKVG